MRRLLAFSLLCILLVCTAVPGRAQASSTAGDYLEKIKTYVALGEYETALLYADDYLENYTPTPAERTEIGHYRMFAQGHIALDTQQYPYAILLFDVLAQAAFLDSDKYWHYAQGCAAQADMDWQAAIDAFRLSAGVKDSSQRMELCIRALDGSNVAIPSTVSFGEAAAETTALEIAWTDTIAENHYTVFYGPEGMKKAAVETDGLQVVLSGLIPNTAYDVTVEEAANGTQASMKCTTAAAQPLSGQPFVVNEMVIGRYRQTDVLSHGLETVVGQDRFEALAQEAGPVELMVSQDSMENAGFGYVVFVKLQLRSASSEGWRAKVSVVLRLAAGGVYDATTWQDLRSTYIIRVYETLDGLLDAAYAENGQWPASGGRVEFYIGDQLAGTVPVLISER